jgi:hypothetical protein
MGIQVNQCKINAKIKEESKTYQRMPTIQQPETNDQLDEGAIIINVYEQVIRYIERERGRF